MTTYKAPLADIRFVMFDLLKVEAAYQRLPGGENATRDVVDAILEEAARFSEQVLAPLNARLDSANLSWGNFPLLSHGASEALRQHGEEWQRQAFLKPIVEGVWTGTMCLTEPHCGSDLGLLKSKAEPQANGTYAISGTKIFITAGEHDLTENIVHLVLARLPD